MRTLTSVLVSTTVGVVAVAVSFPGLRLLETIISIPLWISAAAVLFTALLVYTGVQEDVEAGRGRGKHRKAGQIRSLALSTSSGWSTILARHELEHQPTSTRFPSLYALGKDSLNARLNKVLDLVRKSFILPWYERISPSSAFPDAVEVLLRQILIDLADRSAAVDWSAVMVNKIVPLITEHLHHFRTVEHLTSSTNATSPALPLPLPRRAHAALAQQSHLPLGPSSPMIESHLRELLENLLKHTVPLQDRSDIVMTMLREIVLGTALLPVFDMLCDNDFWNIQIDERGGRYLHEQKQVNRFLSALSALPAPTQSQETPRQAKTASSARSMPPASSISAASSTRQFDAFIKSILKLRTLGEARRLRVDVDREQRAARLTLENEKSSTARGQEAELRLKRAHKHVIRLEKARMEIDKRIVVLSGPSQAKGPTKPPVESSVKLGDSREASNIRLYTVLTDPSSLAYWLEFMDRRGRSQLVQFWLTVEGIKDPLEAAGPDTALDSTLESADSSSPLIFPANLRDDVMFLHDTYFATSNSVIEISQKHLATIRDFAQSSTENSTPSTVRQIKHAVFAGQKEVYDQMQEDDWPDFQRTQLYIKVVTDVTRSRSVSAELPADTNSHAIGPKNSATSNGLPPLNIRRTTSPPQTRPTPDLWSPSIRSVPHLVNGSFTPGAAMPSAALSTAPPTFDRAISDFFPPMLAECRKASDSQADPMASSVSSLPDTLSPNIKRSSDLEFLISGDSSTEPDDRGKLFEDVDEEPAVEADDDEDFVQVQRMEAIQAALNDIIASDEGAASRLGSRTRGSPDIELPTSPSVSMIAVREEEDEHGPVRLLSRSVEDLKAIPSGKSISAPHSRVPSRRVDSFPTGTRLSRRISMPKLSETSGRTQALFDDEFPAESTEGSVEETDTGLAAGVQLAAPGDLQLSVEIARLQDKIYELVKQDALLETLIRQAELTGNEKELHILRKSQASVRREQRTAIFQKAQFEQQEEENRLVPGRTEVHIPNVVTTADDQDGKQVVRYIIDIKKTVNDGQPLIGWVVVRRYNEFWELDKSLREWAVSKGDRILLEDLKWRLADFPAKKLVTNLSASFIETRRIGLERYLQSLISSALLCDSQILRSFLTRTPMPVTGAIIRPALGSQPIADVAPQNIVKSLYKTMATSLDDALLGPSMLDLISSTLSRQLADVAEGVGGMVGLKSEELAGLGNAMLPQALKGSAWLRHSNQTVGAQSNVSATAFASTLQPIGGETGTGSFAAPICDLFIEVFDLKENNWLRRQAIVVILQQFLGSTVERKVRDTVRTTMSAESLERYLGSFQDTLWPDGERRPPSIPRTDDEKSETRVNAGKRLGLLIPDVAANMIGRGNARRAARRVFGALQDRRLNQQLILCILDEVFGALSSAALAIPSR